MMKAEDEDLDDRVGNAIELAIIGKAKRFIKSRATQRVINSIWRCDSIHTLRYAVLTGLQRKMCLSTGVKSLDLTRQLQTHSGSFLRPTPGAAVGPLPVNHVSLWAV
jgi:hypothetical protein